MANSIHTFPSLVYPVAILLNSWLGLGVYLLYWFYWTDDMAVDFGHSTSLSVLLFRLANLDNGGGMMLEILKLCIGVIYSCVICKWAHSVVESKYSIL